MLISTNGDQVVVGGIECSPDEAEAIAEQLSEAAEKARANSAFDFVSSFGTEFRLTNTGPHMELHVPNGSPGFLMDQALAFRVAEAIYSLALRLPA